MLQQVSLSSDLDSLHEKLKITEEHLANLPADSVDSMLAALVVSKLRNHCYLSILIALYISIIILCIFTVDESVLM